jgi:hypothetical protein
LSRAIDSSTALRFSSLTRALPVRMRDTVLGETPAASATMASGDDLLEGTSVVACHAAPRWGGDANSSELK